MQTTREIVAPDGRTLAVREGGDPAGVPVVTHHGTPGSGLLYEPHLRDAAERGIRLIGYDRPGYGGSTRKPGRNVADCAADVTAICDALGIERFCTWGASGGGPHVLAVAALLPDRVAAAAALCSVAPFNAEGLDFTAGMGELNVESYEAILVGEEAHLAQHLKEVASLEGATPEGLIEALTSLVGPEDRAVMTGSAAEFGLASIRTGIEPSADGWFDDEVVGVTPWGFELDSIRVPVLLWHGEQDRFVPFAHGVWLSERIPHVEARLTPDDGHLTILELHVGEVHDWLLARFND